MSVEPPTIVAVSTPRGAGGVALLRLSGPRSAAIAERVFRCRPALHERPRYVTHGRVVDRHGRAIDEGLAWFLKGPASYTGEDTVEITTHGSEALLEVLVDATLHAGAQLAEPGEFTRRAFLNDRIDLLQAEAVAELVQAGSASGLRAAYGAVSGGLTARVQVLRQQLAAALAQLEAGLDFVEDVDIEGLEDVEALILSARQQAAELVESFEGARRRRDGWKIVIAGAPNAGKSSLLNAWLGEDRSIVTDVPGTTRDWVEGRVIWDGEPVRLVDTAGLRVGQDVVEVAGVERSHRQASEADVVVFLVDGSDADAVTEPPRGAGWPACVTAVSKSDLPRRAQVLADSGAVAICALDGSGLDDLRAQVLSRLPRRDPRDGIALLRERHHEALLAVVEAADRGMESVRQAQAEVAAAELQGALRTIGELLGESVDDDVLDRIFAQFCIGK